MTAFTHAHFGKWTWYSAVFDRRIKENLQKGKDVIYVATNISKETRKTIAALASYGHDVQPELIVIYADPRSIRTNISQDKLQNMAKGLHNNKPEQDGFWSSIHIIGKDPIQNIDHER